MVKALLKRYTKSKQFAIKVVYPNNDVNDMWIGLVEFCAKDFSDNELKQIWRDCNDQIACMNHKDIPFRFKELLNELSQIMINRKILTKRRCFT